jgi:HSP90 family molecular chaperone
MRSGSPRGGRKLKAACRLRASRRQNSATPFSELASLLYDQASLADEGQIANGADFARRLNKLLVRLVEARP